MRSVSGACSIVLRERIQSLWSGYGEIVRIGLECNQEVTPLVSTPSGDVPSDPPQLAQMPSHKTRIIKHVKVPNDISHPRGWNTDASHQRKMHSYCVETNWYRDWAQMCDAHCRVPRAYVTQSFENQHLLVLEDLDAAGYPARLAKPSLSNMRPCLSWLAYFHAKFMVSRPIVGGCAKEHEGSALWRGGSYWHLDTRQDELQALEHGELRDAAIAIDSKLNSGRYHTIIHGDAKVANFCFSEDKVKVAAVDFQYVGGGCGMRDVALFISSCFGSDGCAQHEKELLEYYFSQLKHALDHYSIVLDFTYLECEWRELYIFAWADFVRFLKGWSPGHWKIHAYSEALTHKAISVLREPQG